MAAASLLLTVASCHSDHKGWKAEGTVEGADGTMFYLESYYNGAWITIDSAKADSKGHVVIDVERPEHETIYRLTAGGRSVFFPVDSTETITFTSKMPDFEKHFTVSGSSGAPMFNMANTIFMSTENTDSLKRVLGSMMLEQPLGESTFFLLLSVGNDGKPLFDVKKPLERRIVHAIANIYNDHQPGSARTELLLHRVFGDNYRALTRGPLEVPDDVEVSEMSFPEIELRNAKGEMVKLSDIAGKGSPVIVNFTRYADEYSPILTIELGELFSKYSDRGLQIYQVSFDEDEFAWQQAVQALPWVTVFNTRTDGARYLNSYLVSTLPTSFVIDANGDLVKRIEGVKDLVDEAKAVMK